MHPGIFIVETAGASLAVDWETAILCPEWTVSRRACWDTFSPEQLASCREGLLVANAVPGTQQAVELFRWLRAHPIAMPTLAILAEADSDLLQFAADAVDDFLLLPFRTEELRKRVMRLLGPKSSSLEGIQASLAAEVGLRQMVGQDPAFIHVLAQVARFGANDAPVLITGETGTGKELCARVIHLLSCRHSGPFIPVDCGALPDHLFENEFFGHARGAFTDARSEQKGLAALANHGTLFMDEIDGLSPAAQGKLLRLLQEHTYRPLGSEQFKETNVRVVAATNCNLEERVSSRHFRSDLYFRVNVLRIQLPALRERRQDIALLARHFVQEICRSANLARKSLSTAALRKLECYEWPGNVRELYNTIQRAVLGSPGTQIASAAIDVKFASGPNESASEEFRSAKQRAIQRFEQDYVQHMLVKHAGNVTRAALEAGQDRRAFGRLAKKYGIRGAA